MKTSESVLFQLDVEFYFKFYQILFHSISFYFGNGENRSSPVPPLRGGEKGRRFLFAQRLLHSGFFAVG